MQLAENHPWSNGLESKSDRQSSAVARLDLSAVEASLRSVQRDFDRINETLDVPRDPLGDEVLDNLMAGYEFLDSLCAAGVDAFAVGHSRHLLELNNLVLCGTDDVVYEDCAPHLAAAERRFYDDTSPGGVRALMNYMAEHMQDSPWRCAAGAYMQVLSQPQLYIEGNHRTGALIMSQILLQAGKPPFVLTVDNAKAFFDPSSLAKGCRKRSILALLEIPKLRKRLAKLLKETSDRRYLLG